jgi:hypothetical protein
VINKPQITRRPGLELDCRGTERRRAEKKFEEKKRKKHRRGGEMKIGNEEDMKGGEEKE